MKALVVLVSGGRLTERAGKEVAEFLKAAERGEGCVLLLECPEPSVRIVVADLDGVVLADTAEGYRAMIVDGLGAPNEDRSRALDACHRLGGAEALIALVRDMQEGR